MNSVDETLKRYADTSSPRTDAWDRLEHRRLKRRRQRRVSAAVMAVIVAGAGFAIAAWALGGTHTPPLPSGTTGLQSATAQGVTVRYPEGWTLVQLPLVSPNATPGKEDTWPTLQLTNYGPQLDPQDLCPQSDASMPSDGVLLYVQRDLHPGDSSRYADWPVSPSAETTDGACGSGTHVFWRVADRYFQALLVFGPDATHSDRDDAMTTFRNLGFQYIERQDQAHDAIATWLNRDEPGASPDEARYHAINEALATRPRVAMTSGTIPSDWTLMAIPDPDHALTDGPSPALATESENIDITDTTFEGDLSGAGGWWGQDGDVLFQPFVSLRVGRIEAQLPDGSVIPGRVVPLPPVLPGPYQVGILELQNGDADRGTVVAYDSDGNVLARQPFERPLPPSPPAEPSRPKLLEEPVVFDHGFSGGHEWWFRVYRWDEGLGYGFDEDPGQENSVTTIQTVDPAVCDWLSWYLPDNTDRQQLVIYGATASDIRKLAFEGQSGSLVSVETRALPPAWNAQFRVFIAIIDGDSARFVGGQRSDGTTVERLPRCSGKDL